MTYKIVLNKNKHIGKVVFIVEGDKKEHSLLGYIFKEILDYSIVEVKRNKLPFTKYVSKVNSDSHVFVISAKTSNIKSAGVDGKEYLDQVFENLYIDYSLDISNAAVYYIFDRDNESNFYSVAESLTETLKNSRDNGFESNGLLLLSYPCIEAYIKSCIDDVQNERIDTPKSLKNVISDARYQYSKIDGDAVIRACNNMLVGISDICKSDMTNEDLDDFAQIGMKILFEENQMYLENKQYYLLSLLSVAFLDLGILSLDI